MTRIPHGGSPVEVRQAFQRLAFKTGVITDGQVGTVLIGAGSGVAPAWSTILTTLTLLTVDDITINGAAITSGSGAISFADENLSTTGTVTAGMVVIDNLILDGALIESDTGAISFGDEDLSTAGSMTAVNVTSGEDPGHTHTGASVGGIDISTSTNLAVTAPIVLTDDTISINQAGIDHGTIGGLGDDDHTIYSLVDGTRDFSGVVVGVDPTASNHLATKEYVDSAISFIQEFFLTDAASGVGSYFNMVDQHTGLPESSDPTGSITQDDGQALTEWITIVNFPSITDLEHGIYSVHVHVEKTGAGARDVRIYFEVWTRTHPAGAEVLRTTSEVSDLITSRVSIDLHAILSDDIAINETDRIVVKFFANGVSGGGDATITFYSEGTTSSHFGMPTSSEVLSTIFLRQDGTKALAGNLAVDAAVTIDGRDLSVDGTKLDGIESAADVTDATNVAAAGAAMSGGAFHDGFSDFVGNEHIDHTGVSIATAATSGISGGGTIAATRNLSLNINGLTGESAIVAADTLAFYDATATAHRKVTLAELSTALGAADEKVKVDVGATAGYLGVAAGDGVLRTDGTITWTDGGNFVTLSAPITGFPTGSGADSAVNQDIVTGTWTKVVLGTENFDIGGDFASSTFTAPASGYYLVHGRVRLSESINSGDVFRCAIYVNGVIGANFAKSNLKATASTLMVQITDIVYVPSGQTIEFYTHHNYGSNREISSSGQCSMVIHRLS